MTRSFEETLGELETIVQRLESPDLSLDESLDLFEAGIKLSRECRERLTNAERRIQKLIVASDGSLDVEDLDPASLRD